MGKIQTPRKLRSEDFGQDEQEMIGKVGDIYNSFVDDVYNVLNGRIDYSNLNRQDIDINVLINATGGLVSQPQIKTNLTSKIRGITVMNAVNQTNPGTYPTTAPFVSWTINGNILTILNVTGLQNSSEYKLSLELIGS